MKPNPAGILNAQNVIEEKPNHKMKIYTPLEKGLGDWIENSIPSSFEDADIILLPGGLDASPALYGHSKLLTTWVDEAADAREMSLINKAIDAGKFIVAVCKGSQMLTIRTGGWLIQDVTGHHNHHEIETYDGKTFTVNSSHHQMCYPYSLPDGTYEVLGWSNELSSKYIIEGNKDIKDRSVEDSVAMVALSTGGVFREPEVLWFPKIRGLGIASHPEWTSSPADFNTWLNQQILQLI